MAKAINWNNFNRGFGESFLQTLEQTRRLNQQQQQFNQQMAFENRQLDLLQDYRNQTLDINRGNLDINKKQENRLETGQKIDILGALSPSQEGSPGALTGAEWEKQTGIDLYPANKEGDFYSMFQEAMPQPYKETGLTPMYGGQVETQYEVDPTTGDKRVIDYGSFFRPFESQLNPSGGGGEKPYKEGKLSEAGAKALGFFTKPDTEFDPATGWSLWLAKGNEEEIKAKVANNMATFAKDIVSSDTYRYIKNFFDTEGYVDPETLRLNAINDAGLGNLTDQQLNEMATFLNYYDTMYDGIQEIEGFIK